MNSLELSYIQLHIYNNKLIDEQYTGDSNPFFDLDYDLQRQHAKHLTHIVVVVVLLSVPCLPSLYQKRKKASVVSVRKTATVLFRVCITFVFTNSSIILILILQNNFTAVLLCLISSSYAIFRHISASTLDFRTSKCIVHYFKLI